VLLHRYLELAAERTPDAVAVQTDERTLTYADVNAQANAIAGGLWMSGVAGGDRVAVYLDNCAESVIAIFGILKAGAAVMMIHPSTKEGKVSRLLHHAEVSAVMLLGARVAPLAGTLASLDSLNLVVTVGASDAAVDRKPVLSFGELLKQGTGQARPRPDTIDLDLAALLYTSGSTGDAKGVMLTHANMCAAIEAIVEYLGITGDDRLMNVLPLSFGYGLTQLFSATKAGATLLLEKGMVFPHVTLEKMATQRVTGFGMVPTMCAVLLGVDLTRYDLSALRYVTNAAAGLAVPHVRRFRQALPHVNLVLMYGQTECVRISYLDPAEVDARPHSVGRGMPNQHAWIVDDQGNPVPPGVVGELVVRGSHVMRGYWRMPEETAQRLRAGRYPGETVLYTGDLFSADADGYLKFVARRDDIIKAKGEKVSPREVEQVVLELNGVAEAAVVGVDHPVWGQAITAIVVLRPGACLTTRDVQRHCSRYLEEFMVPSEVEFRDELPRTDNGKVAASVLRKSVASA
jgi:amino acid adenylation domain-containing protein